MARILIVDDAPENITILDVILRDEGFETLTAANGKEALEQARTTPPDLIVSDIFMPVMDGFTLLRECKRDESLREIPFVFYTATYTDSKDQDFALGQGADLVVIKPVDPFDLVKSIRGLLEKRGRGVLPAKSVEPPPDEEFLKGYSETVVRKLEEKVQELDEANRALSESERKYHSLFEDAVLGIFQSTREGRYTLVNPALARMFGYSSPDEMIDSVASIGRQLYADPRDRERATRILSETGVLMGFVAPFQHRSGKTIWISVNSHCIRDDEGKIQYYEGTAENVTDKIELEGLYKSLTDKSFTGIYLIQDSRFCFLNQSAAAFAGYSPDELMGKDSLFSIHPDDREKARVLSRRMIREGAIMPFEVRILHKNGTVRWIMLTLTSTDYKGRPAILGNSIDITELIETREKLGQTNEQLKQTLSSTIKTISSLLEAKDPYTAGHQERVARLVTAMAREMDLPEDHVQALGTAALLHDLGKIQIPSDILSKPGKLSAVEYELIKIHPEEGHEIIRNIDFVFPIAEMILQHHERLDGSGYPRGLSGGQILLEARIIAVADVVEAMSSHRPYRPALGIDAALEEIEKNRGIKYDGDVVDACLTLFRRKGYGIA